MAKNCKYFTNQLLGVFFMVYKPTSGPHPVWPMDLMVPIQHSTALSGVFKPTFTSLGGTINDIWGVQKWGYPQNGWFIVEIPWTKMEDDWGYPYSWKPPYGLWMSMVDIIDRIIDITIRYIWWISLVMWWKRGCIWLCMDCDFLGGLSSIDKACFIPYVRGEIPLI